MRKKSKIVFYYIVIEILCPMCREPMTEMCEECGVFYERQEFIVTDLRNFKIKRRSVYKRLDHFKEVLNQFQGKEGRDIPKIVIERLRENMKKESPTLYDVRQSLRKLKLNKYVENVLYIHHVLTGTPLPYIRMEIEDKMIRLFKQLERVFGLVRSRVPFARTSFLNYYFVLLKLLDFLNQPELLYRIPLLKTQVRIKQHDALWRHICEELDWNFKPTKVSKQIQAETCKPA